MVNGNYILYGDRPSSESEIVDDHVHTKTAEKKVRRKQHRTANELQSTLNLAQLDNDTDSVKYEKRVKEPRLLRYVPTTDVEENYVTEKFETYDLKPTEEPPRRYAFTKKPKNPADGSVNYAYSRSSSSCSSPNGNLPTISEHSEQYSTYRVRPLSGPVPVPDVMTGYESKLDKYFAKPRDIKKFAAKGSHPDSLYRVTSGGGGDGCKVARTLQVLRWPAALLLVCVALAVFVYFLMPDNIEAGLENGTEAANGTYWDPVAANVAQSHRTALAPEERLAQKPSDNKNKTQPQGTKTAEIDFYDADSDKSSFIVPAIEPDAKKILPIPPVFPAHLTPEVQYGNEKADTDKLRNPKLIDESNAVPADSTLKPHITQKPEKPLQVYFKDSNGVMSTTTHYSTETIVKAETLNDFTNYGEKVAARKSEGSTIKTQPPVSKEPLLPLPPSDKRTIKQLDYDEPEIPSEIQEFYYRRRPAVVDVNFTSGHSKLFGISIEDAEKMKATTQSSTYNTRVSPTLPTWRDGDDATTKKYPVNVNYDAPLCRSTRLAFCRGVLPYDLAGPEATLNGVAVLELMPEMEYLVATNCSERVRQFMCALLEPECSPPPFPPKMPCYNLCKAITDRCDGLIPRDLGPAFNCNQYSSSNCVAARSPCFPREFPCGDGSCVPRDWICDGAQDCSAGEDEDKCVICEDSEYRCQSGGCIEKRWMCDGYSDCPSGEDESVDICETYGVARTHAVAPTREESAGSAPAASMRRQNRVPPPAKKARLNNQKIGDNESSKEILMTSDSSNALRRNYTRRPSLSRLTPYTRPALQEQRHKAQGPPKPNKAAPQYSRYSQSDKKKLNSQTPKADSVEDVNVGDLGFFEEIDKEIPEKKQPQSQLSHPPTFGGVPTGPESEFTHLDKSINKMEKVIDGATLLKKALAQQEIADSPEANSTAIDKELEFAPPPPPSSGFSAPWTSARASPCPSGELRCVDGRCITLAQLCDGTIDCSDHADEDNCYT